MKDFDDTIACEKKLLFTPLSGGKSLIELSSFNDIALWWFADFDFHYFLMDIDKIGKYDNNSGVAKKNFLKKFAILRIGAVGILSDNVLKFISIIIVELFMKSRQYKKLFDQNRVILFTGQDIEWRSVYDIHSGDIKIDDQFFVSLINKIRADEINHYNLISTYFLMFPYYKSILTLIDKLMHWTVLHIPYEIYYNKKVFKEGRTASRRFKKIWKEIDSDPIFNEILNSFEPEISERIRINIKRYYTILFPKYVKILFTANNLIAKIKPAIVVLENEFDYFQLSLLIAARLQGVPTLAIQHGNISKYHPSYIHSKGEIAEDGCVKTPFYQTPDKTAVYGDYFYNILTQVGGYPKNSVVITGQPRYDILFELNEKYNKEIFCTEHSLVLGKKIILIMTENLPIFNENLQFLESVLLSVRDIPNVQIIIKPHPGERTKWYEEIANKTGVKTIILPKTDFTGHAMIACDVMIAFFSTTINEAILINKPVISVNLTGRPNPMPYNDTGCVTEVTRKKDIYPTVIKTLFDRKIQDNIQSKRNEFIRQYCYKFDGKSSDRVADLINAIALQSRG